MGRKRKPLSERMRHVNFRIENKYYWRYEELSEEGERAEKLMSKVLRKYIDEKEEKED